MSSTTSYVARPIFYPLHMRKERWAVAVCHRRAGKTVACINDLLDYALTSTLPNPRYAYIAPYYSQAKDVAWGYLRQYTANIPRAQAHESELRVDLPRGARIRLYGADNYERIRGVYFDGVVLDEFGDFDPRAWQEVIRPALTDRQGWAIFIGTPKGQNHFYDLWQRAQGDPEWLALRLRASETGILPQAELDAARKEMSEDQYRAEFECDFEASVVGSYWGRELSQAAEEGRICSVPYQPEAGVDTWWDLGVSDTTAIWFTQQIGREIHVIDCYEAGGEGLAHYARILTQKGYVYASHNAPHDIAVRELGSGKSRIESAASLGIKFNVVPNIPRKDGIDAARAFFARCWFDKEKTHSGRLALVSYRKQWDERRKVFSTNPLHDWSSNYADAWRYLAVGFKNNGPKFVEAKPRNFLSRASEETHWLAT